MALTSAVTAGFALTALWFTVRAWQARRTAPRTVSLALSASACVAVLVVAADLPIELSPPLCEHPVVDEEHPVPRGEHLETVIAEHLRRWWWPLVPCRRIQVRASVEDLERPVDFATLADMATRAGIAIDVSFDKAVPIPGKGLYLVHRDGSPEGRDLAITTAIPASRTDQVFPRIKGDAHDGDGPDIRCRFGQHTSTNPSLHELLRDAPADVAGSRYYPISCWPSDHDEQTASAAYVHVTGSEIVLQSTIPHEYVILAGDSSFGVDRMIRVPEAANGALDPRLEAASMLVLDRPQQAASCPVMQRALERGASVVVAMPGEAFLAACAASLPIVEGGKGNAGKHPTFDREPRLTFVLDDFAEDLKYDPTCIFQHCKEGTYSNARVQQLLGSLEVQVDEAHDACSRLVQGVLTEADCNVAPSDLANPATASVRIIKDPRRPIAAPKDLDRLRRSSPETALKRLVEAFDEAKRRTYHENELVVVFTHDGRPAAPARHGEFLETGARLHNVEVRDPYGRSLTGLFADRDAADSGSPGYLVTTPSQRVRSIPWACEGIRCVKLPDDVTLVDRGRQTRAVAIPRAISRFTVEDSEPTEAPLRFGWWTPARDRDLLTAAEVARTTGHSGLRERPLALAAVVGRGHLLFLNYSPFESIEETSRWVDAPKTHLEVLGGYRLIENLHTKTAELLATAGPIHSVVLRPDGAVWVTMNNRLASHVDVAEEYAFRSADSKRVIDAPLVDFDDSRGHLTYALPASELATLPECLVFHPRASDVPIHMCPPGPVERAGRAMNAISSLELLAKYTGGRLNDAGEAGDALPARSIGLVALSMILLAAWGRRAVRRWSGMRLDRRLRRLEHIAQRRYDPPDAVVAAAGDWDGRSTTWPRTGAFGGYRPIEAGDRPSAMVLQDLVLPAQGGPQLLPRVVQRIEEAAPAILVLVNLGESMRVPGSGEHSKAAFAGHVALHVAAAAWKIRGEVAIDAVGVQGEVEIVAPVRLSPGYEELDVQLRTRLHQPSLRERAPWPDELPECGSVVYVSDFQLEDTRALQAWVARLEAAGIRVGGVMVYSPLEFTMIEGGRLAGSGVWADRTDWDPDDAFAAFSRRRDAVEHIFDASTTGGLVVAATHFTQDDVEVALESGRLLQILR